MDYIFYASKGKADSGVVIKVTNERSAAIDYRFTLILKGEKGRTFEKAVSGHVPARSLRTGDAEGLYFAPFGPGASIAEIGLRGYAFDPVVRR